MACSAWEWVLYTNQNHVSVVKREWSEMMGGGYNTTDTALKDRRHK